MAWRACICALLLCGCAAQEIHAEYEVEGHHAAAITRALLATKQAVSRRMGPGCAAYEENAFAGVVGQDQWLAYRMYEGTWDRGTAYVCNRKD